MAKSRKSRPALRDAAAIANGRSPLQALIDPLRSGRSLLEIEDRRQFTPGVREARTLRQLARVTMQPSSRPRAKKPGPFLYPEIHAFRLPRTTVICVRREVRKRVIHAKGIAGGRVKRPKRNIWSKVSCKRRK